MSPKPTPPEVLIHEAARRAQQRLTEHIERFAAAYIKLTDIPPNEAVMCTQMVPGEDGHSIIQRIWFVHKDNVPDLPGKYGPIVEKG